MQKALIWFFWSSTKGFSSWHKPMKTCWKMCLSFILYDLAGIHALGLARRPWSMFSRVWWAVYVNTALAIYRRALYRRKLGSFLRALPLHTCPRTTGGQARFLYTPEVRVAVLPFKKHYAQGCINHGRIGGFYTQKSTREVSGPILYYGEWGSRCI